MSTLTTAAYLVSSVLSVKVLTYPSPLTANINKLASSAKI